MKHRFISGLLAFSLMVIFPSLCLAANALIVHDGTPGIEADALGNLTTHLVAAGFTVTPNIGVPGGSLATYQQIWDIRFNNTTPLTGPDQTAYVTYMNGAGNLFLMGENSGFVTRNNSIVAFVIAAGGPSLTLTTPANTEAVLAPFTGPVPLTTITYLAADGVQRNSSQTLSFITQDPFGIGAALVFPPNRLPGAPTGSLITVFDVNFMQAGADANSQALIDNMIQYLAAPVAVPAQVPAMSLSLLLALVAVLAVVGFRILRNS